MSSIIRLLEPALINRIAAGEVIERPTSVIKELLENSLDAQASEIHVTVRGGGQSLMRVQDNGHGMNEEDLILSVQRHTTSKLAHSDLWNIHTFGFRGEALASITSISKTTLTSKTKDQPHGWSLHSEGGSLEALKPARCELGTCIEIRDLFFATPARLKFLRSPAQEYRHLNGCLERFLLLNPQVQFFLHLDEKQKVFKATSLEHRIKAVLNVAVLEGFWLEETVHDIHITGWASLPGAHRRQADRIFLYVNQRPVDDRMMIHTIRSAYHDLIPKDRYPWAILFLTIPYVDVDVNVHPAKTQVRFKSPQDIRAALLTTLRKVLFEQGKKSISIYPKPTSSFSSAPDLLPSRMGEVGKFPLIASPSDRGTFLETPPLSVCVPPAFGLKESDNLDFIPQEVPASFKHFTGSKLSCPSSLKEFQGTDLGTPLGQIHNRYIVAVNSHGLVVIDPHGAHERILYEEMKRQWKSFDVQFLIPPLVLSLTEQEKSVVEAHISTLAEVGFPLEYQKDGFVLKGIPAVLHEHAPQALWESLLHHLTQDEFSSAQELQQNLLHPMLAHWACRKSIFLGDALSLEEMNALLRAMERTPHSAQCNHGRKVYCLFSMAHIATWFDRDP
ncbi:DNA mismatch repair endonuclease MutL [Holospora curviuscula]|uniref:DNA mismatch repair protein MutL n=1 Tax=Holospora curviuscula TaxID=1082868 RepID=A0A2S5R9I6_9PROT|nr:DNA mismatch repair endonuclease MutL [Holospora curviuscula]PPE03795.1 DNA mismatch repair protein MutL [Holospora curviuscula]